MNAEELGAKLRSKGAAVVEEENQSDLALWYIARALGQGPWYNGKLEEIAAIVDDAGYPINEYPSNPRIEQWRSEQRHRTTEREKKK